MAPSSKSTPGAQAKSLLKRRKERQREYERNLKRLEEIGAYNPTSHELTHHRKTMINRRMREYAEFMKEDDFFFIPVKPEIRNKVLRTAKELEMVTTRKGIFYEKSGQRRATIRKSKAHPDEFEIHFTGKVKWGPNRGKKLDYIVPIAKLDKMLKEKDRFRNAAKSFGKLSKKELLAFKIVTPHSEGLSRNLFTDVDLLIRELDKYEKSMAARLALFRHVVIVKTTIVEWTAEKRARGIIGKKRKPRRNPKSSISNT